MTSEVGDARLQTAGPIVSLDFDSEAESQGQAIDSAIADVSRAVFKVGRVDETTPGE